MCNCDELFSVTQFPKTVTKENAHRVQDQIINITDPQAGDILHQFYQANQADTKNAVLKKPRKARKIPGKNHPKGTNITTLPARLMIA